MPCRSDYMEQTLREEYLQRTAQLAVFVANKLGVKLPMIMAMQDTYYADDRGQAEWLCARLKSMTDDQIQSIVYDGRSPNSRALADWWEKHQEKDRQREEAEKTAAENAKLREQALAKLTKEERAALGV